MGIPSDLKMATHFEVVSTNSQLVPLIEKFLGGIIEEAQMPSISSDEKYIEVELLHITADIFESTVLLKHSREVKGTHVYYKNFCTFELPTLLYIPFFLYNYRKPRSGFLLWTPYSKEYANLQCR